MKLAAFSLVILMLTVGLLPQAAASAYTCPTLAATVNTAQQVGIGGQVVGTLSVMVPTSTPVPANVPFLTCPSGHRFESSAADCTQLGVEAGVYCGPKIPVGRTAACIIDPSGTPAVRPALVMAFDIDGDGQISQLSGESSTDLLPSSTPSWKVANPYNQDATILAFPTSTTSNTYANDKAYINCWLI